jgi:DNA repair exonuclease SbcCD ATPase subunit
VIPEGDDVPRVNPPLEGGRDLLAERRARRAGLASQALLSRTEAAEATVRTLETHLADLRRREVEAEHERERALAQLAERDRELRRVKQREYAEQQQRVEAEEAAIRVRRGHRAELDRLQRRVEQAHAAAQHAEERRAALAVQLAAVSESCVRLERGITALQGVATELRDTFERDHLAARARIAELERQLAPTPKTERDEPAHREEMAGALAAAVERLRARAAPAPEATPIVSLAPEAPVATTQEPAPEIPTVVVVPRLFLASRSGRLRPTVRRIAMRLAEWADRTQTPPA